jgi:phospholipase A1
MTVKIFLVSLLTVGSLCALEGVTDVNQTKPPAFNGETSKALQKWRESHLGLKPYRPNYLLPFCVGDYDYKSYVPTDSYGRTEAEIQVSFKIDIARDLFDLDEIYFMSYSHKSQWQLYTESSPFRETNYNPEFFVKIPIYNDHSFFRIQSLTFGLAHLSNGQGSTEDIKDIEKYKDVENRSRSVNYVYGSLALEHDSLMSEITLWLPYRHNYDLEDNPDIMDYYGYWSAQLSYFYQKHLFTVKGRYNFETRFGAFETTYSHPLNDNVYLFAKYFSGYGDSLIDYNNNLSKFSIGFSFSR